MMLKKLFVLSSVLFFVGCGDSEKVDTKSWSLSLNSDKTKITYATDVLLKTDIRGYKDDIIKYTWKDGNKKLEEQKANITLSNLEVGKHHIVVEVLNAGELKIASKDIIVEDIFSVSITDDDETLYANVTENAGDNLKYSWKEEDEVLGNQSELSKGVFSTSLHHVELIVTNSNGIERNASFDFNISDFTNFETRTLSTREDGVLIQTDKNLTWVSDMDDTKEACLAIHVGNKDDSNKEPTFCQNLEFAGYHNWRKPSVIEIQNFITTTIEANILPAYYAPCKFLIGVDSNSIEQVVITRYGQKVGFGDAGDINGTYEDVRKDKNIGLRCVRSN